MLYLKVLACKALFRELSYFASTSENVIDLTCFEWGLHDVIGGLNKVLKETIAAIDEGDDMRTSFPPYDKPLDGILLGYGLCSNGIVGLSSKRYPLVIPRAHDCITLLLGSKERYRELFEQSGGTYWYSPGWVENSPMPGEERTEWMIEKYTPKYGREQATYMIEITDEWQQKYNRLALISWPEFRGYPFAERAALAAQQSAAHAGWNYEEFQGDSSLIRDFLAGNWDEERFLVVPPGDTVEQSYLDDIIACAACKQ